MLVPVKFLQTICDVPSLFKKILRDAMFPTIVSATLQFHLQRCRVYTVSQKIATFLNIYVSHGSATRFLRNGEKCIKYLFYR